MKSHELANLLLSLPDMEIATHANNHTWASDPAYKVKVGLLKHYAGDFIVIGNMSRKRINPPNWVVTEVFHGEIPENW